MNIYSDESEYLHESITVLLLLLNTNIQSVLLLFLHDLLVVTTGYDHWILTILIFVMIYIHILDSQLIGFVFYPLYHTILYLLKVKVEQFISVV